MINCKKSDVIVFEAAVKNENNREDKALKGHVVDVSHPQTDLPKRSITETFLLQNTYL